MAVGWAWRGMKAAVWHVLRHRWTRWGGVLLLLGLVAYLWTMDRMVRGRFEEKRRAMPVLVYARPLELQAGGPLTPARLVEVLQLAGYRPSRPAVDVGSYDLDGDTVRLVTRPFDFGANDLQPACNLTLTFAAEHLAALVDGNGNNLPLVRLDPVQIGSFDPSRNEDRLAVKGDQVPDLLRKTLLAVEDRNFYRHHGMDSGAVLRMMWAKLRNGETGQSGSTLTQQLVRNLFGDNRGTLWRKCSEAALAMLLELHYSKEEILAAYLNEVFLGQAGNRAVHGFAMAGHFYCRRPLADLTPAQIAMLVGLVRDPSYYDPRQSEERCAMRRAVVLDTMAAQGLISAGIRQLALAAPVMEPAALTSAINRFPAFLDLVKDELLREYRAEELAGTGIRIFTTLDPLVQQRLEETLARSLPELEGGAGRRQGLQAAAVVVSRASGEIEALAGDRRAGYAGFNRALATVRPIGSLVKPAIFLTALEQGYTLASHLEDRRLSLTGRDGSTWQLENFDHREHGQVPLFRALAQSYNLATVRLGLELGVERVVETLGRLGATRPIEPYPSVLLGAVSMTPLEVTQLYLTLADGGFYTPLRGIRAVVDGAGRPLARQGREVEQRFAAPSVFLLNTALVQVVADGTGKGLVAHLPDQAVAGMTGTSDDLRDSWFAGFAGDRMAVTWVGRDDNGRMGLTGATGALPVWGEMMAAIGVRPLELVVPPGIVWAWVSPGPYGGPIAEEWPSVTLPFVSGSAPPELAAPPSGPSPGGGNGLLDRVRRLFGW